MASSSLSITQFGSYFAGGKRIDVAGQATRSIHFSAQAAIEHDPNGTYWIEQAYVQFIVPANAGGRPPVVLVHGGCLTGAMWETTPDGRPGWLDRFLRAGFPVHLVDGVERGRAGWCALPGVWPETPVARSAQEMWTLYRFGPPEGYPHRQAFKGQRHPVAALDTLLCQHVPRWFSTIPAAAEALVAILDRIGPAVLVSHSNGGLIALEAAWRRPDLIAGAVLVEPSGFPQGEPAAKLSGIPFLFMMGDYLDATPLWQGLAAAMTGLAVRLIQQGARVTDWRLAEMGVHGNSHMLMMDDNSDDLAARVVGWIETEVLS
ncbi:alpha/beta fold hydrolase [Rhodopila sp.]|uniref:alpha/beta fold hydrolase n=1 Tax=Rhodopila sp. TaxID=2480087 RepID=UPI003D1328F5